MAVEMTEVVAAPVRVVEVGVSHRGAAGVEVAAGGTGMERAHYAAAADSHTAITEDGTVVVAGRAGVAGFEDMFPAMVVVLEAGTLMAVVAIVPVGRDVVEVAAGAGAGAVAAGDASLSLRGHHPMRYEIVAMQRP